MKPRERACYLLDAYFNMFERDYYHPAMAESARRKFKQYAMSDGRLSEVLLGYIERQIQMVPKFERKK